MSDHLLVNVGNTTTRIARDPGDAVSIPTHTPDYASIAESIISGAPADWIIASVVPDANDAWRQLAAANGAEIVWTTGKLLSEVDSSGIDLSTVGADRIANMAGALALFELPIIILDCGTAITTEVLLTGPRFAGGAILPGRKLLRQALATFTAQLPEVPITDKCPPPVGKTTRSAISAGVDCGILGTVQHLLQSTIEHLGVTSCQIVATGGDADYFTHNLDTITRAEKNLTLYGLQSLARRIRKP